MLKNPGDTVEIVLPTFDPASAFAPATPDSTPTMQVIAAGLDVTSAWNTSINPSAILDPSQAAYAYAAVVPSGFSGDAYVHSIITISGQTYQNLIAVVQVGPVSANVKQWLGQAARADANNLPLVTDTVAESGIAAMLATGYWGVKITGGTATVPAFNISGPVQVPIAGTYFVIGQQNGFPILEVNPPSITAPRIYVDNTETLYIATESESGVGSITNLAPDSLSGLTTLTGWSLRGTAAGTVGTITLLPLPATDAAGNALAQQDTLVAGVAAIETAVGAIPAAPSAAAIDAELTGAHGGGAWGGTPPGAIYTLTVTTKDTSGNPVPGVMVYVSSDQAGRTIASGPVFSNGGGVAVLNVPGGVQWVQQGVSMYVTPPSQQVNIGGNTSVAYSVLAPFVAPTIGVYAVRSDIENIFGIANIIKWAVLSGNDPNSSTGLAEITNRVNWALGASAAQFEIAMDQSRYTLPISGPNASIWARDMVAIKAGLMLYGNIRPVQRNNDGSLSVDRYAGYSKWFDDQIDYVRAGKIVLDSAKAGKGTNAPEATHSPNQGAWGPGQSGYGGINVPRVGW